MRYTIKCINFICGCSSVVEYRLPKPTLPLFLLLIILVFVNLCILLIYCKLLKQNDRMTDFFLKTWFFVNLGDKNVSVSAMLVYIHQKKYRSSFILERYFFVSIYPAAIPGTYLAVFLVAALLLCL